PTTARSTVSPYTTLFRSRVVQLGGALQQPRMQKEDVARISLAAWRPAQQQGDFAIGLRVLGKVVVEGDCVALGVAEVFPHRAGRDRKSTRLNSSHGSISY